MPLKVNIAKVYEKIIAVVIIYLVFFYDLFSEQMGFFDEFIALIALLFMMYTMLFKRSIYLYKNEKIIILFLLLLGFLGLSSNVYNQVFLSYKTEYPAIFGDIINFYKAFTVYFGVRILQMKFNPTKSIDIMARWSQWFFYLLVLFILVDAVANIFPHNFRYGMKTFELFFKHPSRFSFAFSFTFIILYNKLVKKQKWFLLIVLVVGLTSLRVKYFGFVLIAYFLLYQRQLLYKISKKVIFVVMGVAFVVLFIVFYKQIAMYFSLDQIKNGWSRGVILVTSFHIGNDFFPLGTGFGTYSSYFSGKYYSWVYDLYHINNVWGISRSYWGFIADQFWPMVLGQFGYFGLFAYIVIVYQYIILFLKLLKVRTSKNRTYMIAALLGMILLLIDSSSDAIFTQNRGVVMFMLFALFVNAQNNPLTSEN